MKADGSNDQTNADILQKKNKMCLCMLKYKYLYKNVPNITILYTSNIFLVSMIEHCCFDFEMRFEV